MRTLLRLVLVLSALVPALALPCDCAISARSLSDALDAGAAVVFEGRVEPPVRWPTDGGTSLTYTLRATRAWRGTRAGEAVQVTTSASDCGIHVAPGVSTLVAAPAGDAGVLLVQCRRDVWVSSGAQLEEDRAQLGRASSEAPRPAK